MRPLSNGFSGIHDRERSHSKVRGIPFGVLSCRVIQRMLIRSAVPEDALAVAHVHVRAWRAAYRRLLPSDYLERLRPEERAARYEFGVSDPRKPSTLVAVDDGAIVAFATVGPARDADVQGCGELCALYVTPQWWGKQLGCAMIEQGRASLRARGYEVAVLWVLAGNTRAERFYRRDGWRIDGSQRTVHVWGIDVDELRYRRDLKTP